MQAEDAGHVLSELSWYFIPAHEIWGQGQPLDWQGFTQPGTWQWVQLVSEERGWGSREHAGGDVQCRGKGL